MQCYTHLFKDQIVKTKLFLLGNPLKCDCELRWYKQWINDEWNPVEETWLQDTYCRSPKDQKRHLISEVELKDMFCDSSVRDKAGKVRCN